MIKPMYNKIRSFLKNERCPRRLAFSVSLAVFIAFSPFVGFHTAMVFLFSLTKSTYGLLLCPIYYRAPTRFRLFTGWKVVFLRSNLAPDAPLSDMVYLLKYYNKYWIYFLLCLESEDSGRGALFDIVLVVDWFCKLYPIVLLLLFAEFLVYVFKLLFAVLKLD